MYSRIQWINSDRPGNWACIRWITACDSYLVIVSVRNPGRKRKCNRRGSVRIINNAAYLNRTWKIARSVRKLDCINIWRAKYTSAGNSNCWRGILTYFWGKVLNSNALSPHGNANCKPHCSQDWDSPENGPEFASGQYVIKCANNKVRY